MQIKKKNNFTICQKIVKQITQQDLPLSCPQNNIIWHDHPKVYLNINPDTNEIVCPYCGIIYQLNN